MGKSLRGQDLGWSGVGAAVRGSDAEFHPLASALEGVCVGFSGGSSSERESRLVAAPEGPGRDAGCAHHVKEGVLSPSSANVASH